MHKKDAILEELKKASGALTVNHIVVAFPGMLYSAASRGLRRLWKEQKIEREIIPGDSKKRKMWFIKPSSTLSPLSLVPVLASPVPDLPKNTHGLAYSAGSKGRKSRRPISVGLTNLPPIPPPAAAATIAVQPNAENFMKLEQVVTDVSTKFVGQNRVFSAFDVTKHIREEVNAGKMAIDDQKDMIQFHGQTVPGIKHEVVRDYVHKLFDTGMLIGYDRDTSGSHWEYRPQTATAPAVPASSAPTNNTPPTGTDGNSFDGSSTL